jgi:hypothetical protein
LFLIGLQTIEVLKVLLSFYQGDFKLFLFFLLFNKNKKY